MSLLSVWHFLVALLSVRKCLVCIKIVNEVCLNASCKKKVLYSVVDMHEKCRKNNWCGKLCSWVPELQNSCFYKIGNCRLQLAVINFVE